MNKLKSIFVVLCVLAVIFATIDEYVSDKKEYQSENMVLETEAEVSGKGLENKDNKEKNDKKEEEKEIAKKEVEEQVKKGAAEQAKKKTEEKKKKEAAGQAKKKAEEKKKKEAAEQAKKKAEEAAKRNIEEENDAEKDNESDFWDDAKKFVKEAVDTIESGTELVKGYSFKLNYDDDGYSFVSDECEDYSFLYEDFEYEAHLFKGYVEYEMSVSTRNKIRKSIKKELDTYMKGAADNEFAKVSVNDDLSKFTFWIKDYEPSDIMDEEFGSLGEIMTDLATNTIGYEYLKKDLFEREWYNWAYFYQFFNRNGGTLVRVEFIDADTGESLYTFK